MKKLKVFMIAFVMLFCGTFCFAGCETGEIKTGPDNNTNTNTEYNVKIENCANGIITVDKNKAKQGETINVTATPASGYTLSLLTCDGVTLTTSTVTMPNHDILLNALFSSVGGGSTTPSYITLKNGNYVCKTSYNINDGEEYFEDHFNVVTLKADNKFDFTGNMGETYSTIIDNSYTRSGNTLTAKVGTYTANINILDANTLSVETENIKQIYVYQEDIVVEQSTYIADLNNFIYNGVSNYQFLRFESENNLTAGAFSGGEFYYSSYIYNILGNILTIDSTNEEGIMFFNLSKQSNNLFVNLTGFYSDENGYEVTFLPIDGATDSGHMIFEKTESKTLDTGRYFFAPEKGSSTSGSFDYSALYSNSLEVHSNTKVSISLFAFDSIKTYKNINYEIIGNFITVLTNNEDSYGYAFKIIDTNSVVFAGDIYDECSFEITLTKTSTNTSYNQKTYTGSDVTLTLNSSTATFAYTGTPATNVSGSYDVIGNTIIITNGTKQYFLSVEFNNSGLITKIYSFGYFENNTYSEIYGNYYNPITVS